MAQWHTDTVKNFPNPMSTAVVALDWENWWPVWENNELDNIFNALRCVRRDRASIGAREIASTATRRCRSAGQGRMGSGAKTGFFLR